MVIGTGQGSGKQTLIKTEPEPIEIDLQSTAVIVIDMQNAFLSRGGFFDLVGIDTSQGEQVIERIKEVCNAARARQVKVIHVVFRYSPDLREMGNPNLAWWHKGVSFYRDHPESRDKFLIRGTWGAEIVKELEPKDGDLLIEKHKYSAFSGTSIDVTLKTCGIKYLLFLGAFTNICVEASLRDSFYHGYFPILVSDATASLGPEYTKDATIFNVRECYGWVTTTKDLMIGLA
jgi:ureidoacrylate peracid hydrolase